MIDTITLRLDESEFRITDHNKFSPCTYNFYYPPYTRMGSRGYLDAYQNPTRKELLVGKYKPQLTLRKKWQGNAPAIYLYIQFSAPKMLYGNNFDEISDLDLDNIIMELNSLLNEMGVRLRLFDLRFAKVTKIHYSKNILLPEYVISSMVIGEVKKSNISLFYDISEKDYRNEGHSFRFHTNEFELILYDKIKDLQKSSKSDRKSIEKDNAIQLNLFDNIPIQKPFDVLRIELRLNTPDKIYRETRIDKKSQTLEKMFNSEISINLLSNCWGNIIKNYHLISCDIEDKENFLAGFLINNPDIKLTNALAVYSALEFFKDIGARKFRNLIEARYTRDTWYALNRRIRNYNMKSSLPNYLQAITNYLEYYEPLRLESYKEIIESS